MTASREPDARPLRLSRRGFLLAGAGAGAALFLPACGGGSSSPEGARVGPGGEILLAPRRSTVDLAGKQAKTWTYGGQLPGREIRVKQGDRVRVRVENKLPESTSVHWHGIRLANPMDGVPHLTQDPILPGSSFLYDFVVPDSGTFMFHSHVGMQIDRGLYAPLIVDARNEPLAYDAEAVLLLDDWIDGVDGTPEDQLQKLETSGMQMGAGGMAGMDMGPGAMPGMDMSKGGISGMDMEAGSATTVNGLPLRSPKQPHVALDGSVPPAGHLAALATAMEDGKVDVGDVQHPLHLINGQPPKDPMVQDVRKGERVRLRLINIAADTHFLFFVEGHELTVTHADGAPVKPLATDAVLIGMGERYDVTVTAKGEGSRRMIALPLGKKGDAAVGVLRDVADTARANLTAPFDMPARVVSYTDLRDAEPFEPPASPSLIRADLAMDSDEPYAWSIGGHRGHETDPIEVSRGDAVSLTMRNSTMMPHPMHLHGHYFRPVLADGLGARKDTIVVPPMTETAVVVVADNPGRWAFHCHNAYHQNAGMERELRVNT